MIAQKWSLSRTKTVDHSQDTENATGNPVADTVANVLDAPSDSPVLSKDTEVAVADDEEMEETKVIQQIDDVLDQVVEAHAADGK